GPPRRSSLPVSSLMRPPVAAAPHRPLPVLTPVNPHLPRSTTATTATRRRSPGPERESPPKKAHRGAVEGQRRAPPRTGGRIRGVRGVVPPEKHCEPVARGLKSPEHRATPGGYGGKPPGVAIIGVPTGARNAGSDAPTGDQSIDMNRTRKH